MKGYEMIVLVNGILFLAIGGLTFANGLFIQGKGFECATGNATRCERDLVIGGSTLSVAPYLVAFGAGLLGLAASLILYRRWYRPSEPGPDEGPDYP